MLLKITEEFTDTPGGRYKEDGLYSGEEFRDDIIIPKLNESINNNEKLTIDFDGGYGYASCFLEEVFGGLVRKGYTKDNILNNIEFISLEDDSLIEEIYQFVNTMEKIKSKKLGGKYEKYKRR